MTDTSEDHELDELETAMQKCRIFMDRSNRRYNHIDSRLSHIESRFDHLEAMLMEKFPFLRNRIIPVNGADTRSTAHSPSPKSDSKDVSEQAEAVHASISELVGEPSPSQRSSSTVFSAPVLAVEKEPDEKESESTTDDIVILDDLPQAKFVLSTARPLRNTILRHRRDIELSLVTDNSDYQEMGDDLGMAVSVSVDQEVYYRTIHEPFFSP